MDAAQRHALVLERLRADGRVEVEDLAQRTGSSTITVRRDLEHLAELGALRRVRGGAVSTSLRGQGVPFAVRTTDDGELKARLGKAAAGLIVDDEAVAVDSGTTGRAAAVALAGRRLTAVPLSVQSLVALAGSNTALIVPGGEVDPVEGSFGGPLTVETLAGLRLDTVLLTCCGVGTSAGVMAYSLGDAATKRAAVNAAARAVLVAESSKFSKSAMALVCPLARVSVIVSDTGLPRPIRQHLEDLGIELVLVNASTERA